MFHEIFLLKFSKLKLTIFRFNFQLFFRVMRNIFYFDCDDDEKVGSYVMKVEIGFLIKIGWDGRIMFEP